MSTPGSKAATKTKSIPNVNLTDKCAKCAQFIKDFRIARHKYLNTSNAEEKQIYKSVLLGLMSSIGEQVAYIRAYHREVGGIDVPSLPDYAFIIPELRNISLHHLSDTAVQRGKLEAYRGVKINNMEDILTYITSPKYEGLLRDVEHFQPPSAPYTRTVQTPIFSNQIGPVERLKMAKEAADEVQKLLALKEVADSVASSSPDPNILLALDFHLARMCVAYEDYREELARCPSTHSVKTGDIQALIAAPDLAALFHQIHIHKLALAHGEGSVAHARQALLSKMSNCQAHFQRLIIRGDAVLRQAMMDDIGKLSNEIKNISTALAKNGEKKFLADKLESLAQKRKQLLAEFNTLGQMADKTVAASRGKAILSELEALKIEKSEIDAVIKDGKEKQFLEREKMLLSKQRTLQFDLLNTAINDPSTKKVEAKELFEKDSTSIPKAEPPTKTLALDLTQALAQAQTALTVTAGPNTPQTQAQDATHAPGPPVSMLPMAHATGVGQHGTPPDYPVTPRTEPEGGWPDTPPSSPKSGNDDTSMRDDDIPTKRSPSLTHRDDSVD